jgi:hypothetical protein
MPIDECIRRFHQLKALGGRNMEDKDHFDELRQKASLRARIAAETGRARKALRSLRFRTAARHLKNALELSPEDTSVNRRLRWARFASWFQYVVLILVVAALGFVAFMIATQWGPALLARLAPTVAPTPRFTATPTYTRRIPTQTPTATQRASQKTSPMPTPIPPDIIVEVLHSEQTGQRVAVEFKVLESGTSRTGLQPADFRIQEAGFWIPFLLQERNADDPVCMVVVVDNSGSIIPGLEQIRSAIRGLNDKRKPGDQLGLVLFAEPGKVEVKQKPSNSPLDETVVNGQGQLTALWDGILKGIEQANTCSVETRYLIVLTDGADNGSVVLKGDDTERALQIAQMAEEQNLGICTIGVQSDALKEEPLKLAAERCRYSSAAQFDELVSLFQDIFGSVRHFYRLEFSTELLPQDTKSVTLRVLNTTDVAINVGE